ncbi:unnamed protein product, partial [Effrenium voratum]
AAHHVLLQAPALGAHLRLWHVCGGLARHCFPADGADELRSQQPDSHGRECGGPSDSADRQRPHLHAPGAWPGAR